MPADPREMFQFLPWPFPDGRFPAQLGAVVMRTVLDGERPALEVAHLPDGDWAVADGVDDPNEPGAATVAHLWHVIASDPTLEELASLAPGTVATRRAAGDPWVVSDFEWADE